MTEVKLVCVWVRQAVKLWNDRRVCTRKDRWKLIQHNLCFSITISVKLSVLFQWRDPELSRHCAFTNFQNGRMLFSSKPFWIMLFMYCHLACFCSLAVVFLYSLKFNHASGSLLHLAFLYILCFRWHFRCCSPEKPGQVLSLRCSFTQNVGWH